jgi:hypothetical protein
MSREGGARRQERVRIYAVCQSEPEEALGAPGNLSKPRSQRTSTHKNQEFTSIGPPAASRREDPRGSERIRDGPKDPRRSEWIRDGPRRSETVRDTARPENARAHILGAFSSAGAPGARSSSPPEPNPPLAPFLHFRVKVLSKTRALILIRSTQAWRFIQRRQR